MYGPEKATPLNVYAVMKSGIKSVDSSGNSGEIRSHKAQKRMVCMFMFFSTGSKD